MPCLHMEAWFWLLNHSIFVRHLLCAGSALGRGRGAYWGTGDLSPVLLGLIAQQEMGSGDR